MLNLNNAEKQLLERHPGLATALKFEEYAQLDQQIEATQYDTFNTQIEKGKLILEIEEKLKDQSVKAMLEDMEMSWSPTDIQRILRISNTWYYRLKKAAKFATGNGAAHTQNLYRTAVHTAKSAGQEVKIDIDSFNKVAKAKADAMKAADTTRYSDLPVDVKNSIMNSLVDTSAEITPEEVATEISQELSKFFEGSMKIKVDGQWKQIKFSTNRGSQTRLEGDTQNEFLGMFQRACAQYIFDNVNTVQDEN
jgi:dihydroneopterin aldolase